MACHGCRNIPGLLVTMEWSWKNEGGWFVLVGNGLVAVFRNATVELAGSCTCCSRGSSNFSLSEMVAEFETDPCTMRHTSCEDIFLGRREKYFTSWLEEPGEADRLAATHQKPFCKFTCPLMWRCYDQCLRQLMDF